MIKKTKMKAKAKTKTSIIVKSYLHPDIYAKMKKKTAENDFTISQWIRHQIMKYVNK